MAAKQHAKRAQIERDRKAMAFKEKRPTRAARNHGLLPAACFTPDTAL
jgi:hypothetical protein